MRLRTIFCLAAALLCASLLAACKSQKGADPSGKKVIVLAIDGMDPALLKVFMDQGRMPNFSRLAATGDFKTMRTTIPAQSPVAWASFITSQNPGRTGIFDFIHRQPKDFPFGGSIYLSTSVTREPERGKITLGSWQFATRSAKIINMVAGRPFWDSLTDARIPVRIFRVPSDYPPYPGPAEQFSGMGTPDLLGTYGTFSYYTDNPPENSEDVTGGEIHPTFPKNNLAENFIYGPPNSFRLDQNKPWDEINGKKYYNYRKLKIPFKVYLDADNPVAKVAVSGKEIFLKQGEWSGWVQVEFEVIPHLKHLPGMVKFYLKEIRPDFKLYVSPVEIDPGTPAAPIYSPESYGEALVKDLGLFYTQGMAEDTKALTYGVFNDREYWEQSQQVTADWFRAFRWHLDRFDSGFLFFYFSTLDLGQHMFWRYIDRKNPLYSKTLESGLASPVEKLYQEMDLALGLVLPKLDQDTTLIVISDHGFAPFNRQFNLNSWLLDNGYLFLIDPGRREKTEFFENVDWGRTRAYGLGINGLYLNLQGREGNGVVPPEQADQLLRELKSKLEALVDPKTRKTPVKNAYLSKDVFTGPHLGTVAPDIIIGYRRGYRASWETTLGEFPKEVFADNLDPWSGDHCIDPTEVPATLLTNKKILSQDPALWDIGPTVLKELGVPAPKEFEGRPIF